MKKYSKRFKQGLESVDQSKTYDLKEAISIFKKIPQPKFDQSVDLDLSLNVDPKKADQMVRGTVILPHGTGRKVRVAVFAKGEAEKAARAADADFVGAQDLMDKVSGGWLGFDVAVATPEMMRDLSKLGKVLGPRGLMPSPKTGTVTNDVTAAVKQIKAGKVEFRVDKQSGIHCSVGRVSFDEQKIYENVSKFMESLTAAKPSSVKGKFIKNVSLSTTMGPGVRINV
ncbi:MAG TPA: 50S ribosomal protein L1 [Candidatus Omnitrophica bacterium]|nr:50S ribosomal protein L1 [Candidatus Omnitrophota bacterium]